MRYAQQASPARAVIGNSKNTLCTVPLHLGVRLPITRKWFCVVENCFVPDYAAQGLVATSFGKLPNSNDSLVNVKLRVP